MSGDAVSSVDIVCVVWRETPEELRRYGEALAEAWAGLPDERRGVGVLVENGARPGAGDEAAALLAQATGRPPVRIALERNAGPACAYNTALSAVTAPYAALMDSDSAPEPDLLLELASALDCAPDALVAAGQVVGFAEIPAESGPAVDAEWVSAGASLYRVDALRAVGSFDELFAYSCEEMDLCYRARAAGWRCLRVPRAVLRHEVTHKASARRSRRYTQSVMAWRHIHSSRRVAAKAWLMQFPHLVRILRQEGPASAAGGLLGLFTYFATIPACERRRR